MHQKLGPRALYRQRFDLPAVPGKAAVLDQPPLRESFDGGAVRGAVERYRKLEVTGIDTDLGTGERHPFGVASELEFWRAGAERTEIEITIGEDRHFAVRYATMNPARHLQDLVGPEIQAM